MDPALAIDPKILARAAGILARTRVDREGGEGTYAHMIRSIANNGPGAIGMHASLERVHERARRNLRDALAALGQAMAEAAEPVEAAEDGQGLAPTP